MITKTSDEAQKEFGQLLDLAQREPVEITRHGRPAVFVIAGREMEMFDEYWQLRRAKSMADWEEWRQQARASMTPEAAALTDDDVVRLVHEVRGEIANERELAG